MKSLIFVLIFTLVICVASGIQQLDRPEGKVIAIGNITANNIGNLTNMTNVTGIFPNQTHLDLSEHNASIYQPNVGNESVMETPTNAQQSP